MVAFLLGGTLSKAKLASNGKAILIVSLSVVILTATLVFLGLFAIGTSTLLALLLAGIATATAPAATQDAIRQIQAKGPFTDTLLGVVAVDDAWGLILFSILLATASAVAGEVSWVTLGHGLWELGGAFVVGAAIGLPAAFLTGRLQSGEPMQAEALGLILICAGLSTWLGVSFLLAGMVAGAIVTNLARHHNRPFHEIEHIEWPFMVLFFVLSGASLHLGSVAQIGGLGIAYIVLRMVARIAAGWLGATWAGAPVRHRMWIGLALTPQAGVALGMTLVAVGHFPEFKEELIAITIGTTVFFELIGPALTQLALRKVGEAK